MYNHLWTTTWHSASGCHKKAEESSFHEELSVGLSLQDHLVLFWPLINGCGEWRGLDVAEKSGRENGTLSVQKNLRSQCRMAILPAT